MGIFCLYSLLAVIFFTLWFHQLLMLLVEIQMIWYNIMIPGFWKTFWTKDHNWCWTSSSWQLVTNYWRPVWAVEPFGPLYIRVCLSALLMILVSIVDPSSEICLFVNWTFENEFYLLIERWGGRKPFTTHWICLAWMCPRNVLWQKGGVRFLLQKRYAAHLIHLKCDFMVNLFWHCCYVETFSQN